MGIINTIKMSRLKEYYDIDEGIDWGEGLVTISDIENGIKCGVKEQCKPYRFLHWENNEWHIGRIIYFIKNPEMITPITIETVVYDGRMTETILVADGHHRLMAHVYLNNKYIEVDYGGRLDILDYLVEESDIKPEEWI